MIHLWASNGGFSFFIFLLDLFPSILEVLLNLQGLKVILVLFVFLVVENAVLQVLDVTDRGFIYIIISNIRSLQEWGIIKCLNTCCCRAEFLNILAFYRVVFQKQVLLRITVIHIFSWVLIISQQFLLFLPFFFELVMKCPSSFERTYCLHKLMHRVICFSFLFLNVIP